MSKPEIAPSTKAMWRLELLPFLEARKVLTLTEAKNHLLHSLPDCAPEITRSGMAIAWLLRGLDFTRSYDPRDPDGTYRRVENG
jgi:hypothetical protein